MGINTSFSSASFIRSKIAVNRFRIYLDDGFKDGYRSISRLIKVTKRSVCADDNGSHAFSMNSVTRKTRKKLF